MSTGPLGGGGFFGEGGGQMGMGPQGPYGMWPSCGCGSLFVILGGLLIAFGGCMNMFRM
jgi:hypothetical protein